MKGKRSKLGRRGKIGLTILIAAMFIGVATAQLLPYFGIVTTTAEAHQTVLVDGKEYPDSGEITDKIPTDYPGGETFCFPHWLKNKGSVPIDIELKGDCSGKKFGEGSLNCDGITTTYLKGMKGRAVSVVSKHLCEPGSETKDAFDAEPEKLVLDDMPFDAQTPDAVTIEGKLSDLKLGANWVDTAYVEIGVRPSKDKDNRNAGVYMIAFNAVDETWIHLQDYTGQHPVDIIKIDKDSDFQYKITLTPNPYIGGKATLELWDNEGTNYGPVSLDYGYESTWEENVPGSRNEKFDKAHLFYSIIADRRGVEGNTYSAKVGDIKTNSELPTEITILAGARLDFYICHSFDALIWPGNYKIVTTITLP